MLNISLPSLCRYQDIIHSIHLSRKGKLGLRTCDGFEELLKYLRSDIQEVASRLHKGGLGYLEDNVDIEEQVTGLSHFNMGIVKMSTACWPSPLTAPSSVLILFYKTNRNKIRFFLLRFKLPLC